MQTKTSPRKVALSIGCLAHIIQDGLTATVFVLLPLLAQTFGLNYAQVGLFKGLKSLTQALLEIYSGAFTEWIGECRTIIFGLILSGIGYSLLTFAPGELIVMVSLLIVGAGTAFQHAPSSALIISEFSAETRRGPLGIYNSSGDVGKLLFSGTFSLLVGAGVAWQNLSFGFAVAAVLAGVTIFAVIGGVGTPGNVPLRAVENEGADVVHLGWGILNWPAFATLLAVILLDTMVQTGILVFVAFLMLAKGLPLGIATATTVVVLLGGVFGKAGCGYLSNRIGVRPAFYLIQLLTAVGLVIVVLAPSWLSIPLLLPLGAVVQGSTSITYGFAADFIHPRRMARGYALIYSAASFSSAFGPYLFGVIADVQGIEMAVTGMAVVALLAIAPMSALRIKPSHEEGQA